MAEALGISPSYLNLIESNQRPLPAHLLVRLAQIFHVDLQAFADDNQVRIADSLQEVFGDPLLEVRERRERSLREPQLVEQAREAYSSGEWSQAYDLLVGADGVQTNVGRTFKMPRPKEFLPGFEAELDGLSLPRSDMIPVFSDPAMG